MANHNTRLDERELTPEELEAETGAPLPDRHALSLVDFGGPVPRPLPIDGGPVTLPPGGEPAPTLPVEEPLGAPVRAL
jgi:hypothetical protein